MKLFLKMFLIFLLVFLIVAPCLGTLSLSAHNPRRVFRNGFQWSGHPSRDFATQWAQDVEDYAKFRISLGTGSVCYVDSEVDTEGDGTSWDAAKNTLQEAIDLCEPDRGDFILCAQGGGETLTAISAVNLDISGVTVKSAGRGSSRYTITSNGNEVGFIFSASNVAIDNFWFTTVSRLVRNAILVKSAADNFAITNCEFSVVSKEMEEITDYWSNIVEVQDFASGGLIAHNRFSSASALTVEGILFGAVSGITIADNFMMGDYSTANINNVSIAREVITEGNTLINGHLYTDGGLNAKPVIEYVEATSAYIAHNSFAANLGAQALRVADDCICVANFVINSDGDEYSGIYEGLYTASFPSVDGKGVTTASTVSD